MSLLCTPQQTKHHSAAPSAHAPPVSGVGCLPDALTEQLLLRTLQTKAGDQLVHHVDLCKHCKAGGTLLIAPFNCRLQLVSEVAAYILVIILIKCCLAVM